MFFRKHTYLEHRGMSVPGKREVCMFVGKRKYLDNRGMYVSWETRGVYVRWETYIPGKQRCARIRAHMYLQRTWPLRVSRRLGKLTYVANVVRMSGIERTCTCLENGGIRTSFC